MEKLKYNVGDTVRIIKNITYGKHMDHYIGKTFKIERISDGGNYVLEGVVNEGFDNTVWYEDELEEVQKMPKFKTGDRVKVIEYKNTWDSLRKYIGTTGVAQEESDIPYVRMDIDGETRALNQDELELAEEKTMEQPQIKTGHLVMTDWDNQWRLAQVDTTNISYPGEMLLYSLNHFGFLSLKEHKVLKVAEANISYIFKSIKDGTPIEQAIGFKIIYDSTKDEAKDKLRATIDKLQDQLKQAQDELKEMA